MMFLFVATALAAAQAPAGACPTVLTHEAQACRALEASKAGRFADAAAAFEQAADLAQGADPARDRALAAAGNMWIAAGQPGKAAVSLDKALAGGGLKAEQHGLALLDRARAAEAQGDLKTARAKINEAAKTIGEDPYLWYFSAAISLREEDIPAAKSSINRALAMVPDSAEVLFEAGHIAKAGGEDAQARDYWTRAIAADPNGPTGKAARQALAMTDAPLAVTNQVATRPDGDGEGGKAPE
ncbi:MAG: tetratricopeptide repeat protein [Pseudomonadota bacterium]|nr:tetratricopeptide repeat protein [Pseudomonadota bacterium]